MAPKGGNAKKESGRAKKAENEANKRAAEAVAKVRTIFDDPCSSIPVQLRHMHMRTFPGTGGIKQVGRWLEDLQSKGGQGREAKGGACPQGRERATARRRRGGEPRKESLSKEESPQCEARWPRCHRRWG